MKRRSLLQSAAFALSAPSALPAAPSPQTPAEPQPVPPASDAFKLEFIAPPAFAQPVPLFFTSEQLSVLRRLGDILFPTWNGRPGALETQAAEFLDFYVSKSKPEHQALYRNGLDRLNADAKKSGTTSFAELTPAQAEPLLKPLTEPWTYKGPSDPFARFLLAAKEDLLRATTSSKAFSTALAAGGRRGGSNTGYYWLPLD